jgi:very-short-patch-repair endonuclease
VRIRGVGRVDLVIGDRLVIECDSREFHDKADSYAADRARDLELLRQGYREIRLTYAQVVYH